MADYLAYAVLAVFVIFNLAILVVFTLETRRADREYAAALRRIELGEKR